MAEGTDSQAVDSQAVDSQEAVHSQEAVDSQEAVHSQEAEDQEVATVGSLSIVQQDVLSLNTLKKLENRACLCWDLMMEIELKASENHLA